MIERTSVATFGMARWPRGGTEAHESSRDTIHRETKRPRYLGMGARIIWERQDRWPIRADRGLESSGSYSRTRGLVPNLSGFTGRVDLVSPLEMDHLRAIGSDWERLGARKARAIEFLDGGSNLARGRWRMARRPRRSADSKRIIGRRIPSLKERSHLCLTLPRRSYVESIRIYS